MAQKNFRFKTLRATINSLFEERASQTRDEPTRLYKFVHFWLLVVRSFAANRCPLRASALSYTTLLALIPMLAVALSVTSSLLKKEGEQQIYQFIDKFVAGVIPPAPSTAVTGSNPQQAQSDTGSNREELTNESEAAPANPDNATNVATSSGTAIASGSPQQSFAATNSVSGTNGAASDARMTAAQREAAKKIHEFIQNTQSGAIAGVGMLALVYIAIRMLSQVEDTFNDIWGVTRGRNWFLRIVIYWAAITLGPLLLAGALGLSSGPHFQATQDWITKLHIGFVVGLLPIVVLCLAFAFFYKAVPNTKVHFSAALIGGLIGGSLWHLNNVFGFLYVSRVVSNSKLYGSLGLVPVFMFGIYLSWLILLFGAQVAYAFQNRALYLQERLAENVNQRGREFVALRLMTCIGQRFHRGLLPATIPEMSAELGIPSRLVQQVLQTLIAAHLVIEISGAEPAYTPARPLEQINAHHILQAMRATVGQEILTRDEPVRQEVYGEFARIQEAERHVASAVTMVALVNRAESRGQIEPPSDEELKLKPALVPRASPDATDSAGEKAVGHPAAGEQENPAVDFTETPENPEPAGEKPHALPKEKMANDEDREFPL